MAAMDPGKPNTKAVLLELAARTRNDASSLVDFLRETLGVPNPELKAEVAPVHPNPIDEAMETINQTSDFISEARAIFSEQVASKLK